MPRGGRWWRRWGRWGRPVLAWGSIEPQPIEQVIPVRNVSVRVLTAYALTGKYHRVSGEITLPFDAGTMSIFVNPWVYSVPTGSQRLPCTAISSRAPASGAAVEGFHLPGQAPGGFALAQDPHRVQGVPLKSQERAGQEMQPGAIGQLEAPVGQERELEIGNQVLGCTRELRHPPAPGRPTGVFPVVALLGQAGSRLNAPGAGHGESGGDAECPPMPGPRFVLSQGVIGMAEHTLGEPEPA